MAADAIAISLASQRRRERERTQRRENILRGAEKIFVKRGYLRTTMDDIALAAEVSKPTLYTYFRGKDDLLLALVLPVLDTIGDEIEAVRARLIGDYYHDGEAFVRDFVRALLRVPTADPEVFHFVQLVHQTGLIVALSEDTRAKLDARGRRDFVLGRATLEEAMQRGLIAKRPVGPLADILWGTVVGTLQVQDIKAETQRRDRGQERDATLCLAEQLLVDALLAQAR